MPYGSPCHQARTAGWSLATIGSIRQSPGAPIEGTA